MMRITQVGIAMCISMHLGSKYTTQKHVYLILGEPRTGKTTLAKYGSSHENVVHFDTDGCTTENLVDTLLETIKHFCDTPYAQACFITVGRHRKHNEKIQFLITKHLAEDILFSICHVRRA